MMHSVNGWLIALAFLLGLVLTLFLLIRRVKREVPEYATLGVVEDEPYGAGSIRVKASATAPEGGYDIKGNEDSMLYHTAESSSYKQTIAEVWFRDEPAAQAAGFNRWDSGKSQRDTR
jgi:uncharacterized membrane protein ArfC